MGRINKPNKATPVSADEFIIYDSEDTSDDKNITLGQVATFTESQNSTISGSKIFANGVQFEKGNISFGQYNPLPTGYGTYVASYVSPTYGARLLSYDGSTYQDLAIGSIPTAGTVSMKSLANGDCDFGYNVNIAEDLDVTGDITGAKFYGDGSGLTDVGTKNVTQLGTSSTASATAEKAVTLSGFVLATGATIQVTFTNANTADVPTLNVNATGAKAIYNEAGTAVSATNPFYALAGATVEFIYNGTNWIFKKRVIENYINGTSWYRVWSDGWIEQGGSVTEDTTVTLLKSFKNTSYSAFSTIFSSGASSGYSWITNATASTLQVRGNSSSLPMCWIAKGY